uniref:Uncharacterized protein n=1 Tax=Sphaerodactylus townsendi TaxID=933632 RepID=A0ACB8F776_9SAUR
MQIPPPPPPGLDSQLDDFPFSIMKEPKPGQETRRKSRGKKRKTGQNELPAGVKMTSNLPKKIPLKPGTLPILLSPGRLSRCGRHECRLAPKLVTSRTCCALIRAG